MSSHVVVIDSSARRAVVKVTPGKFLTDVLHEACTKFGVDSNQYTLKNNNKTLDLSRTFRLSGLTSGSKLELVLGSKSPSVVSVALQLPESEAKDIPNGRLTDKFPSSTTMWLILRKFESAVAGGAQVTKNFTARGIAQTSTGGSGAGRVYYDRPILNVMGRELSSFTDLQKTLAQLGINSGSALIRLTFKSSDTPLDEAMVDIEQYFKSIEAEDNPQKVDSRGAHASGAAQSQSTPETNENPGISEAIAGVDSSAETAGMEDIIMPDVDSAPDNISGEKRKADEVVEDGLQRGTPEAPQSSEASISQNTIVGPDHRPISVFAAPTSTSPQASHLLYNEGDYEPTVDHAKLHQARLANEAKNRRLLSEAELAAARQAAQQKLDDTAEVELKLRYPDQTQIVSKFTSMDTTSTLYSFVAGTLDQEDQPFALTYSLPRGPKAIPKESNQRLIRDLGLTGRVLVNFVWDENASSEARTRPALKEQFRQQAKDIKVEEPKLLPDDDAEEERRQRASNAAQSRAAANKGTGERKTLPKWLKLPGKK
ncbi:putative UBX domain protein [Xylona heveae TC161]|uniref:Putative UBX domain protein n=1 Tax=Xylona heveae (strain CBS 132557 / TC161) TaxID=1328760 RepID=A0A161TQJ3_XYLHT|nr:putative UBX domain protein [Xylona heveae TC161]KZF24616.1 putative UBX domain protein [Xylona heveae TC161]